MLIYYFLDVQAVLLTDRLIFLQEKDQKYIFATVVRHRLKQKQVFLFNPTDISTTFLNIQPSSGPEAPRHRFAEVDRARSCQRGKRHVFDQRLVVGPGDVRGPHVLQRRTEHLDEAHQRGCGKV